MERLLKKTITPGRTIIETSIRNRLGLHPRLACEFVRCANRFQSALTVKLAGRKFSARDLSALLEADLAEGTSFTITAEGPDASIAASALDTFLRHLALLEDPKSATHRLRSFRRNDGLVD